MDEQKRELAKRFTEACNLGLDKFFQNGITIRLFRTLLDLKCKLEPLWLIERAGPFFFKYRNEIAGRDINFFIDRDYSKQREDWLALTKGYGESIALAFEESIRSSLSEFKNSDPELLEAIPLQLLKMYARYVQFCQEE